MLYDDAYVPTHTYTSLEREKRDKKCERERERERSREIDVSVSFLLLFFVYFFITNTMEKDVRKEGREIDLLRTRIMLCVYIAIILFELTMLPFHLLIHKHTYDT